MLIQVSTTNETKGYRIYDSEPYESFTDNIARLFLNLQKEYGACKSSVFNDIAGKAVRVGWYFEKKVEYSDNRSYTPKDKRFYVQGAWVTFYEKPAEVTKKEFPLNLDK